jgi:hypothetical protein
MDEVEIQQRLTDTAISAAFGAWRSQLRVHLEESHALRGNLEKKSQELRQLQQSISNIDIVRQENEQLREELRALRSQSGAATSRRYYEELQHERDALLQDNQLKQKTIDSLRVMVNYERSKSKDWLRYSKSSSPSVSEPRNSPGKPTKAGPKIDTVSPTDRVSALSRQALLQKLVSAPAKSPNPLAQGSRKQHSGAASVEDSANEDNLPPPPVRDAPEHRNGHMSFPDFDATYSFGDSSSELPPTASPHPHSSPALLRPNGLPLPCERSGQPVKGHSTSDSTAPPSQPCHQHEDDRGKLSEDSSLDSLEVVTARPIRRRAQKLDSSAGEAKLAIFQAGNAEEPIRVKSEPLEGFQAAGEKSPGFILAVNENLGRESFDSPKRGRGPQLLAAPGPRPTLHIAEDETLGPNNNNVDVQHVGSLCAKNNDRSRGSLDVVDSRPLQEIKNEERILPRTSNTSGPPSKKRRSNDGRGQYAIPIIAEDGEDHNRSRKTPAAKLPKPASPSRSNISAHRRLGNLLEGPSPAKPVLAKPSPRTSNLMDGYLLNAAASAKSAKKEELDAMRLSENKSWGWYESAENLLDSVGSPRPPRPEKRSAQASHESNEATRSTQHEPQRPFLAQKRRLLDGREDEEPFRSRPLHQLDFNHFKINPNANDGVDYAYTDVIRNRDQRKCLPGCTRHECCGSKFRALAGTLPTLTDKGKVFLGSGPSGDDSSQQSDNDILMNFLGPGSEEKVRTLTSIARENLLLEAKTKIAADRYGKMHRYTHERAKSPPGFWRTEMPGTQEEAVDRLDAKKREREEVERRHREACKEGGSWMFADE